jgi:hypothetical protein
MTTTATATATATTNTDELIDETRLAAKLGVTRSTLQSWRYAAKGPRYIKTASSSATASPTSRRTFVRRRAERSPWSVEIVVVEDWTEALDHLAPANGRCPRTS